MPQTIQFPLRHTLFAAEGVVLCLIKLWCPVKIFVASSCHDVFLQVDKAIFCLICTESIEGGRKALPMWQVSPTAHCIAIQVTTLKYRFSQEASSKGACQSEINFLTWPGRAVESAISHVVRPSMSIASLLLRKWRLYGWYFTHSKWQDRLAAVKREKERKRLRTDAILNLLNMACNADEKRTLATSHTLIESRIDMPTDVEWKIIDSQMNSKL